MELKLIPPHTLPPIPCLDNLTLSQLEEMSTNIQKNFSWTQNSDMEYTSDHRAYLSEYTQLLSHISINISKFNLIYGINSPRINYGVIAKQVIYDRIDVLKQIFNQK